MDHLEIEVKFYITQINAIRDKIVDIGSVTCERLFETNVIFEDKGKNLVKNRSLLRLRQDAKTLLTFKTKPDVKDDNFKIVRELEVEVSNFKTMARIFEFLGFHKEKIYEKWRETFVIKGSVLCIDTLPYGDFLEIEGEKESIKELAEIVGLNWDERITTNYLELFEVVSNKYKLPFSNITFANFKNIDIDFKKCLSEVQLFKNNSLT